VIAPAAAQSAEKIAELRKQAQALYSERKLVDAAPLYEQLAKLLPNDPVIFERLGACLMARSTTHSDAEQERLEVISARKAFLRSKELGNNSNYLHIMLEIILEDGRLAAFAERKDVDAAIREGESAFARGDMDQALAAYQRALALDPRHYLATLFVGDVYFNKKVYNEAARWFAAATEIDADKETAFRYWGDALMLQGKMAEARERFIDAVIAEPYSRRSWAGILQWAQRAGVQLSHPRIESPNRLAEEKDKTSITLDAKALEAKDGRASWLIYEITRAAWKTAEFKKNFPEETEYRHTLEEEADALRQVAEMVAADLKAEKIEKLDPQLENLLKLHQAGLVEAYVLLARVDSGIAVDYARYRQSNRENIRRYLTEWVVPRPAP
jgi:tetratricopeptide (TPR) repeat protein